MAKYRIEFDGRADLVNKVKEVYTAYDERQKYLKQALVKNQVPFDTVDLSEDGVFLIIDMAAVPIGININQLVGDVDAFLQKWEIKELQ